MDQKNLMAQVAGFLKRTTTGELPAPELAELSEEALQQIVGGVGTEATAEVGGVNLTYKGGVPVGQYTLDELLELIGNIGEDD